MTTLNAFFFFLRRASVQHIANDYIYFPEYRSKMPYLEKCGTNVTLRSSHSSLPMFSLALEPHHIVLCSAIAQILLNLILRATYPMQQHCTIPSQPYKLVAKIKIAIILLTSISDAHRIGSYVAKAMATLK